MPMFLAPGTRLAPLLAASMNPGPPPVHTTKCWLLPVSHAVHFRPGGYSHKGHSGGGKARQPPREIGRRKRGTEGRKEGGYQGK